MLRNLGKFLVVLLLVLPSTLLLIENGRTSLVAHAQDADLPADEPVADVVEGEDEDEATVETEDLPNDGANTDAVPTEGEKEGEESEEEEKQLRASPKADTFILFTRPVGGSEFPAGATVRFLVGFTNTGDKDFLVETMDASFRYPQDYSFYIQNFTNVQYNRVVEPSRQATFEYAFTPNENFNSRPFGLTINLNYKDIEGNLFQDAVYNDTITIVEPDEGLDGETFFLYIFLAAIAVLLLVGAQQTLATFSKKRLSKPRQPVEMGTQAKSDIDYDWLPEGTLTELNKSPKRSPRQSPGRKRQPKRASGAED